MQAELDIPVKEIPKLAGQDLKEVRKKQPSDFKYVRLLGEGSYAQVQQLICSFALTFTDYCQ
jgi:hypothetical protein